MLRDYNLDPPNGPDGGDPCAECGQEIGEECFEVEGTFKCAGIPPTYVCSPKCRSEYLQGYADHMMDQHDWD
jgi:hypothetical protein